MKLNYRDKVILGILLAIVILIGGFVGLIKPKNETIKSDKAALEQKEIDRDEVQAKLDEIVPLTNEINDTYASTNKLAGDFVDYDSIYKETDLDQFMQEYAEECELKVSVLEAGSLSEGSLDYYYFTPTIVGEEMFNSADLNGAGAEALSKDKAESDSLSQRNVETVLTAQYAITATGTKDNIWKYMEGIEEQDDAIIINSVTIADYTFGEATEDGTRGNGDGESVVNFVVSLYSVYEMDKPNTNAD